MHTSSTDAASAAIRTSSAIASSFTIGLASDYTSSSIADTSLGPQLGCKLACTAFIAFGSSG